MDSMGVIVPLIKVLEMIVMALTIAIYLQNIASVKDVKTPTTMPATVVATRDGIHLVVVMLPPKLATIIVSTL